MSSALPDLSARSRPTLRTRTRLQCALMAHLSADRYDLSWLEALSPDDGAAAGQLQHLLRNEDHPIARHYMFCELEHRLYRLRQSTHALESFDLACEQHHAE